MKGTREVYEVKKRRRNEGRKERRRRGRKIR